MVDILGPLPWKSALSYLPKHMDEILWGKWHGACISPEISLGHPLVYPYIHMLSTIIIFCQLKLLFPHIFWTWLL